MHSASAAARAPVPATRLLAALLFGAVCLYSAATGAQDYGDTPYVPTPQHVVDAMLELAHVGPQDFIIDLGSGDGRMVITAAQRFGARGFGVDLDHTLVERANRLAREAGVADRAVFYLRDLYKTDLRRATVVTMYLLPEVNLMVRPKLLTELAPGTRVVSHDYDMGEWKPDRSLVLAAPDKPVGADFKSKVYYWVVPAVVSGEWRGELAMAGKQEPIVLKLDQMFQEVSGTLNVGGHTVPLTEGRLSGSALRFFASVGDGAKAARYRFSGHVTKQTLAGEASVDSDDAVKLRWHAAQTRPSPPAHAKLKAPVPPLFQ